MDFNSPQSQFIYNYGIAAPTCKKERPIPSLPLVHSSYKALGFGLRLHPLKHKFPPHYFRKPSAICSFQTSTAQGLGFLPIFMGRTLPTLLSLLNFWSPRSCRWIPRLWERRGYPTRFHFWFVNGHGRLCEIYEIYIYIA